MMEQIQADIKEKQEINEAELDQVTGGGKFWEWPKKIEEYYKNKEENESSKTESDETGAWGSW